MVSPAPISFWHRIRVTFRWCRIVLWLLVLALVCAFLWLNRVGVPDFAKEQIAAELEAKGLRVAFKQIRWLWYRGIVAEEVRFQPAAGDNSIELTARTVTFRPDLAALTRRRFRLHGIQISGGSLVAPLVASNLPPRALTVEDLQAQVDFLSSNRWQLSALEGRCLGVKFSLSGTLTNGPSLLAWKSPGKTASAGSARFLNLLTAELEQVQFTPSAHVRGTFSADAAQPELASAQVTFTTMLFNAPWGSGRNVAAKIAVRPLSMETAELSADLSASTTQMRWGQLAQLVADAQAEISYRQPRPRKVRGHVQSSSINTLWGRSRDFQIQWRMESTKPEDWAADADWSLSGQDIHSRWGDASELNANLTARPNPTNAFLARSVCKASTINWDAPWFSSSTSQLILEAHHARSNGWPHTLQASLKMDKPVLTDSNLLGDIRAALRSAADRQAEAAALLPSRPPRRPAPVRARSCLVQASAQLAPLAAYQLADTNTTWRERIDQLTTVGKIELGEVELPNLTVQKLEANGGWRPPIITIDQARLSVLGGNLSASGRMDVARHELGASLDATVDPHQVLPFVMTNAPFWRKALVMDKPPQVKVNVRVRTPDQRHRFEEWKQTALAEAEISGEVHCGGSRIHGVALDSAQGRFDLSNGVFRVGGLEVIRPEGNVQLALSSRLDNHSFLGRVRSTMNPAAFKPLLKDAKAGEALDYFQFTLPPEVFLETSGRWKDLAKTTLAGTVFLTNASFRGQAIRQLSTRVTRTNHWVDIEELRLSREEGTATADRIRIDLNEQSVNLTNLHSTLDVGAVAAAIGPHIVKTLAPYQFEAPPEVFFEGRVGLHSNSGLDDSRFEVTGGKFEWFRFKLDRVNARLHWLNNTLGITNFSGLMRGGEVRGHANFDFAGQQGTHFGFDMHATNVDAKPLTRDLFPQFTNNLEGALSGHLLVTSANTLDDQSWQGRGTLSLRDGLLWDMPVFKILSPVMNTVVPGIGNSRARNATGTFLITNSLIISRDLEVNASAMRLQFDGSVDFTGALNAKVEAELFRDTPGFGFFISRLLWPVTKVFAYKIQGALGNPKLEPLYIPKLLMAPFHPFRALRELFSEDKLDKGGTNAPTSLPSSTNQVSF